MYLYPEDIIEIAGKCKATPTTMHLFRLGERLEGIAQDAIAKYGEGKASVSVDASAARGYALSQERNVVDDEPPKLQGH
jgi:hypothetical protein